LLPMMQSLHVWLMSPLLLASSTAFCVLQTIPLPSPTMPSRVGASWVTPSLKFSRIMRQPGRRSGRRRSSRRGSWST
ncbi:hypothetical protein H0H87_010126, partial [Tephrocybe sp. NHM501043]